MRRLLASAVLATVATAAAGGAVTRDSTSPTTFSVTRLQAAEIEAVSGFIRSYNARDLARALAYFTGKPRDHFPRASDCDYRHRATVAYYLRSGVKRWLRQRFADHDHLTLGRIYAENPRLTVGVVGVEYARRTSDTLRDLGYQRGIAPQATQKLLFVFVNGNARFRIFGLASTGAPTPNPECALVAARG